MATPGGADAATRGDRTRISKVSVTVMVVDQEDAGSVDLSSREPQVGRSVIATLDDDDGGETAITWQWYRGGADPDDADNDGEIGDTERLTLITALQLLVPNPETDPNNVCGDTENVSPVSGTQACVIDGATSALYTPDDDDENWKIRAVAAYKDAIAPTVEEYAIASSERAVEISDPANTPPVFPDQDLDTAGDQSDTAMRSVKENAKDEKVGEPIGAGDADNDLLLYTHSGDDAGSFNIDKTSGQLSTKVKLDFETKDEYTVMVTATDPSGAIDSITVTIMVTDENDGAIISTAPAVNTAPAFPGATANRSVDENMYAGEPVGEPVAAVDDDAGDTVTYTLSESMYFEIDENSGQITTTMELDEEDMSSHMVMVTATDSEGETDSVSVAITVNDSQPGCDSVGDMGLVNDCEALLDSEDALGGSLNWADDTPMSDWDGVTMSGDRVTAINLMESNLDGMIPGALGRVSMLASLNLKDNDLTGDIPASLGSLGYLEVLNLHHNKLSGGIPDLSGTMLEELYLNKNYYEDVAGSGLSGEVPAWLNGMTDMRELWLWGNQLTGEMPDLSGMTSLERLKLNGNMVSGFQADMLPSGLRWLIIGQTDIGANAPDLSGMMSLTTLWMNETGLSGVIPVAGIPTSVTSLNLKDNMLSGTIPDMSGLDNLVLLRLHRNQLSGDIPGTLGDLESIERIWAYDNDLTGIAAGFANAADTLTHLYLDGNSFAEGTCLPGDLADVANNDFEMAGLEACQ